MPQQGIIQWFPGHMAKTRRIMRENLKNVDLVIEVLDARIPYASRNPDIPDLIGQKPELILLNKASLADPAQNRLWQAKYESRQSVCILTDCIDGRGLEKIPDAIRTLLSDRIARYEEKGMHGRRLFAMVVGIPNVGKSSLINRLSGNKKARVEDRPGVTRDKQWVATGMGIDLLDMPGVLWPKFDNRAVGENLALTGAIKDDVLDIEELACILCTRLRDRYPELLCARYKLGTPDGIRPLDGYSLLTLIGKKRGFLAGGGEINTERTAIMLLDEFRGAKIGRITLDDAGEEV